MKRRGNFFFTVAGAIKKYTRALTLKNVKTKLLYTSTGTVTGAHTKYTRALTLKNVHQKRPIKVSEETYCMY